MVADSPMSIHFLPACLEAGSPALLLMRLNIVYSRDAFGSGGILAAVKFVIPATNDYVHHD